ncbi:hypothetical protein THASP1DRAFT_21705 [Thamnocephalis sphaerospora]|uniref:E3 ubiquitin protein ligase n=1 Tax=Thamnocephalis sphaerospora TaxID=78915 RepID=A0A4P9XYV9_9FUNG|nr:hypothetical protein THASP1DRAFT_21705 [Thamnocephalis sphaerospora]|eukprot:RKP10630.1 hypothetical protein THASP1DRAFT_21705 [Thamnocephalis sphaerospora]
MDDRKRNLKDSCEEMISPDGGTSGIAPPSKKQATFVRNVGANSVADVDMTAEHGNASAGGSLSADGQERTATEKLLQFQKEAIWRQMQEYKRSAGRLEQRVQQLETSQDLSRSLAGHVDAFWHQLAEEVTLLSSRVGCTGAPSLSTAGGDMLGHVLSGSGDVQTVQAWLVDHTNSVMAALRAIGQRANEIASTQTKNISSDHESDHAKLLHDADELRHRQMQLTNERDSLSSMLRITKEQLREAEEQSENLREELRRAERAVDRLRSQPNGTASPAPTPPQDTAAERSAAVGVPADAAAHTTMEMTSTVDLGHLEALQRLADSRLAELNETRDERIRLRQEIDSLRLQLAYMPDERIMETSLFQRVQENCNYYKADAERQRAALDAAQQELENLKASQRRFTEQIECGRIMVDGCLTAEVRRLKMKIAAETGDKDAFDYYSVNEELSLVDSLRKQLKDAEAKVVELERERDAREQASAETQSVEEMMLANAQLEARLAETAAQLQALEEKYNAAVTTGDPIQHLGHELDAREKALRDLELKCEFYQKTEAQLLQEMMNVSEAWSKLEEQSSRKVLDLAVKEDQIVQLLAEKTKYDQKYGLLNKQKDSISNVNIALRRQSEKQLEQIRRLEEHEKNLDQQLASMERELAAANTALQQFKDRLAQFQRQADETTEKLNKSDGRFTEACENEAHTRKRVGEDRDALQQRVDQLTRQLAAVVAGAGDEEMRQRLDEYKTLLKCGSCNIRFKSHVLSRCMHVFCKECIDSRVETRQRKCPICGEAFGINDIRQVYL